MREPEPLSVHGRVVGEGALNPTNPKKSTAADSTAVVERNRADGADYSLYSTVMKYSVPTGLYLLMSAYGHHFSDE